MSLPRSDSDINVNDKRSVENVGKNRRVIFHGDCIIAHHTCKDILYKSVFLISNQLLDWKLAWKRLTLATKLCKTWVDVLLDDKLVLRLCHIISSSLAREADCNWFGISSPCYESQVFSTKWFVMWTMGLLVIEWLRTFLQSKTSISKTSMHVLCLGNRS